MIHRRGCMLVLSVTPTRCNGRPSSSPVVPPPRGYQIFRCEGGGLGGLDSYVQSVPYFLHFKPDSQRQYAAAGLAAVSGGHLLRILAPHFDTVLVTEGRNFCSFSRLHQVNGKDPQAVCRLPKPGVKTHSYTSVSSSRCFKRYGRGQPNHSSDVGQIFRTHVAPPVHTFLSYPRPQQEV